MRGWLLDTNVVSELRRPQPDPSVRAFVERQPGDLRFLSEVTFAEIRFGIDQLADVTRSASLQDWLDHVLRPLFEDRVLSIGEDVLLRWKTLHVAGRKRGHTFSQPDLFIASMAIEQSLIVVSRDTREFVAAGVPVLDPWQMRLVMHAASAGSTIPSACERLFRLAGLSWQYAT